jgi:hypothetical protein
MKTKKTQSQIMRNVIFRLWEKDNKGLDFDSFYYLYTEKIINKIKEKLI